MPKKDMTPEERKAWGAKMRAAREAKKEPKQPPKVPKEDAPGIDMQDDINLKTLQRQLDEVMETNALLKAAVLGQNNGDSVGVKGTQLVGEVDKYLVDEANYPDPTPRLSQEARLQTIAFGHNYELDYEFKVRSYETKTGLNMREPEFTVTLSRIVLDDQGNRVKILNPKSGRLEEKRYRAKRLMFHEDPQAALVIARENNLDIDKSDERVFLNEMRYIRVRDWLFDVFWPRPADQRSEIQEEAVGGTIVQFFTKSSEDPSNVDFDKLDTKIVT